MTLVTVLGGGISGLSAAYYLARFSPETTKVVLVEGSHRVGGWIRSQHVVPGHYPSASAAKQHLEQTPGSLDSQLLFEAGPRSLRPVGAAGAVVLEMTRHLGLADSLLTIPKGDPSAKNRYIYYNDQINTLPNSLSSLILKRPPVLRSVPWSVIREPFVPSKRTESGDDDDDESLHSLVSRRFNEHTALNLLGSVVHGIYAGDVKALSAKSTFRVLYENERVYGSIVKGLLKGGARMERFRERGMAARARKEDPDWFGHMESMSVFGFKEGTEMLTRELRRWLEESGKVEVLLNEPVQRLQVTENGQECKVTTSRREIYANHVISALPSHELSRIIPSDSLPHLNYNSSVDVAVVNLAYPTGVGIPYNGFGFLTPHPDSHYKTPVPGVLGVVFDSNAMKGQDGDTERLKVTVMMGGHAWSHAFGVPIDQLDPNDAYLYARKAMRAYLGIDVEPEYSMVSLQAKCIPQYLVGHERRLGELHAAMKKQYGHLLSVTGASYWGVSVPDCVKNSRELVEELLVAGCLGSRGKVVTGLNRLEESRERGLLQDSARLSKGHVNVLMKS